MLRVIIFTSFFIAKNLGGESMIRKLRKSTTKMEEQYSNQIIFIYFFYPAIQYSHTLPAFIIKGRGVTMPYSPNYIYLHCIKYCSFT